MQPTGEQRQVAAVAEPTLNQVINAEVDNILAPFVRTQRDQVLGERYRQAKAQLSQFITAVALDQDGQLDDRNEEWKQDYLRRTHRASLDGARALKRLAQLNRLETPELDQFISLLERTQ